MARKNVNATANQSIDVIALNRSIFETITGTAKQTMDTTPYKVLDKEHAIVCINPDCKSTFNKKSAIGMLTAYVKAGLVITYEYRGVTAYEFIGNDEFTPHGLLSMFIDLEDRTRNTIKADRKATNERNAMQLAAARKALATLQATERDKAIADYHAGKISREEMLAIVNA